MAEPRVYYQDEWVTLWHGDARGVLPLLEPCTTLVTDIPYGEVNRASGGLRSLDKEMADVVTFPPREFVRAAAHLAESFYVFCGTEQVSVLRRSFVRAGMTTRLGVWNKTNPSPMNGENLWLSSLEACVFARKPLAYFSEHCKGPLWTGPTDQEDWDHPTPKPRWLMERLITASCPPNAIVLDPFAGSGTTLVAAKSLARRAIGVEIEERHCATAAKRLSQNVLDFGGVA